MHERQKPSRRPLVLAIAASLALMTACTAAAQDVRYIYIAPVKGLAAPPAEKPPVSSPDVSVPSAVYPGASYTVTWGSAPEANRYDLFQQSAGSAVYSGADFSLARIAPTVVGATDAFWVRACNAAGCAATSPAHGVTVVVPPAPPAPSISAPDSVVSGGSVDVSWPAVSDPNGYPVTYLVKSQQDTSAATTLYSGAGLSTTLSKAVSPSTYTFTAQACNPYACSIDGPSASTLAVSGPASGQPGMNLTGPFYPGVDFSASWTGGTLARVARYEVTRKEDSGPVVTIYSGPDLSGMIPGGASVGAKVTIQARGCNVAGCGSWSTATATMSTPPAPPAPTISAPGSVEAGAAIALSWDAVTDPNGYPVTYKVRGHKNSDADAIVYSGSGLGATGVSNAVEGASYSFAAQACNPYACSTGPTAVVLVAGTDCAIAPQTYVYAGGASTMEYSVRAPSGCNRVTIDAQGAGGGAGKGSSKYVGANGDRVTGSILLSSADSLLLRVGVGGTGVGSDGGCGYPYQMSGGGWSSDVMLNGAYIAVAAGGYGAYCGSTRHAPSSLNLDAPYPGKAPDSGKNGRPIPIYSYYGGGLQQPYWGLQEGSAGGVWVSSSDYSGKSGTITLTWSKN